MIHIAEVAGRLNLAATATPQNVSRRGERVAIQQAISLIKDDRALLYNSDCDRFAELCLIESLYVEAMLVVYKPEPRRYRTALLAFGQRRTRHHYLLIAGSVIGITRLFTSQSDECLEGQVVTPPAVAAIILTAQDKESYSTILMTSPGLSCAQGLSLIDTGWTGASYRHYNDLASRTEAFH